MPSPKARILCTEDDPDTRDSIKLVTELENGFRYQFLSHGELIPELANFIQLEHECCPFLTIHLTVEPGDGSVLLEMTGPEGTKQFLAEIFSWEGSPARALLF